MYTKWRLRGYPASSILLKWKKASSLLELRLQGPVDIQGIAREFVDFCVNEALNKDKVRHIIEGIAAIASDIFATGGAASAAKAAEYVKAVSQEAISCLTNERQVQDFCRCAL